MAQDAAPTVNWWGDSALSQLVFPTPESPSVVQNLRNAAQLNDKAFLVALLAELRTLSTLNDQQALAQLEAKGLPWLERAPIVESVKRAIPLIEVRIAELP